MPIRVEIGPRDLEKGQVIAVARNDGQKVQACPDVVLFIERAMPSEDLTTSLFLLSCVQMRQIMQNCFLLLMSSLFFLFCFREELEARRRRG